MKSNFEDYLDLVVYRNHDKEDKSLAQDQLEELCLLFAIEDTENLFAGNDSKDEILSINYNQNASELVEWIARLCCEEHFLSDNECEDIADNIIEISKKAFIRFYGNRVGGIYEGKLQNYNEEDSDETPSD